MKHSRKRSNIVPLSLDPRSTNALKYKPEYCQLVTDRAKLGEFPRTVVLQDRCIAFHDVQLG